MSSTAFPIIQTQDMMLNRIQTNIQNTFAATQGTSEFFVGQVMFSPLSLTQFQSATDTTWVKADGTSSAVGTAYQTLTNAVVIPGITAPTGTTAYIKVN